eukprot:SM000549S17877  [mRNA]  locus=s549:46:2642:+ [translate_table: standard]
MPARAPLIACPQRARSQKSEIAELVRSGSRRICLAIGDGANDVGMIQKANIGVGIAGAVMAADFAVPQFRFLERLLLVHGGWSYKRLARMINYFFYKNFVFGFSIFFYNALAQWSGQAIYWDWYLSLYNVIFTAFPICVVACIDQDVKAATRLRFPGLYRQGQRNSYFTVVPIIGWLLNGLLQVRHFPLQRHLFVDVVGAAAAAFLVVLMGSPDARWPAPQSAICTYLVLAYYWIGADRRDGRTPDLLSIGTTLFTVVLFTVNLELVLAVQYWAWPLHVAVWGELVLWFLFLLVVGAFPDSWNPRTRKLFVDIVAPAPSFYVVVLLVTVAALLPDLLSRYIMRTYFPEDHHIVQEISRREYQLRKSRRGSAAGAAAPAVVASSSRRSMLSGADTDVELARRSNGAAAPLANATENGVLGADTNGDALPASTYSRLKKRSEGSNALHNGHAAA